jgi:hypothetical protein
MPHRGGLKGQEAKVKNAGILSKPARVLLGCLGALVSAGLCAQAPGSKAVPLVSDACPTVRGGDRISLEWYPGFDDEAVVTGLRTFTLTFSPLQEDGVNVNGRQRFVLGKGAWRSKATPAANGYFQIEVPVPRTLPQGTYHLVDADSTPLLPPEDRYLKLKMTNSPVESRFCITVVPGTGANVQESANSSPE